MKSSILKSLPTCNIAVYKSVYHSSIISQAPLKRLTWSTVCARKTSTKKQDFWKITKKCSAQLLIETISHLRIFFKAKPFSLSRLRFPIFWLFFFLFFAFCCSQRIWFMPSCNICPILPVFHAFFIHWAATYSDLYLSTCRQTGICTFRLMCSWKFYDLY